MLNDILPYFPFCGHNVSYGLFETPISQRKRTTGLSKKLYGTNTTYYADAIKIPISSDITLLDMFHGFCVGYAKYFADKNPDFETMVLERSESFWNRTNHAFCIKHLDNGVCIFADARGLTDNPLEFFADFKFSKNNMNVIPVNITPTDMAIDTMTNGFEIFERAYNEIFANCPYLNTR